MRSGVPTAIKISTFVLWVVKTCGLVGRYLTRLHGVVTQKTNIDKITVLLCPSTGSEIEQWVHTQRVDFRVCAEDILLAVLIP
jgi:hypothetical protein